MLINVLIVFFAVLVVLLGAFCIYSECSGFEKKSKNKEASAEEPELSGVDRKVSIDKGKAVIHE